MPPVLLTDSPGLVVAPPVHPQRRRLLDDHAYANWSAVFEDRANAGVLDFLLEPGDYRGWGSLDLSLVPGLDPPPGHTPARPRTIRYFDGGRTDGVHPAKRTRSPARIDSFVFRGEGARHWLLQGLTIRRPGVNCVIRDGARDITVDFCLIEDALKYSIRIVDASHCTIQRCVIRDTRNVNTEGIAGESSGVQVGTRLRAVAAIKILDNEIYNVGDSVQLTQSACIGGDSPIEARIEGNDMYLEPSRYIESSNTTLDENAIDLKAGSNAPDSTLIRRNRMWGIRRNGNPVGRTAAGEIIVMHQYCRNVLIEDNIMGDAPRAISDFRWPNNPWFPAASPRNIVVRSNQFYEIRDYDPADAGAITRPVTSGIVFEGNYFARSAFVADVTPPSGYEGKPHYTGNTLIGVRCIQRRDASQQCAEHLTIKYEESLNIRIAFAPHGYETYERKRWTGPEFAEGAKPAHITPGTVDPISTR